MPSPPEALPAIARRPPSRAVAVAVLRALELLGATLCLLPLFVLAGWVAPGLRHRLRRLWCRAGQQLLGLTLHCQGRPASGGPTLFLANHVSYLDILLLGAVTEATFIAKAEVAGWPLLGTIGRAAGTFFIRRRWQDARLQRDRLAGRLRKGESFILFAEGTSTDGLDVLPLKTSLLSVAEPGITGRPILVQPVTLAYRRLSNGAPITARNCHRYAWIGDASLVPHLWAMLRDEGCAIEVVFGAPVPSWAVTSRKVLGRQMRAALREPLTAPASRAAAHAA